jgi:hypothetical protein
MSVGVELRLGLAVAGPGISISFGGVKIDFSESRVALGLPCRLDP